MEMKRSLPKASPSSLDWLLAAAAVAILTAVFGSFTVNALFGEVNSDAGYYVSLARLVSRGCVPYIDFPSAYPPGGYYLLALAGEGVLTAPALLRALVYIWHVVNATLLFGLLRHLAIARLDSLLWCALFLLWTLHADGKGIVLEQFQVTFLLSGVLALLAVPGLAAFVLAGLALGAALFIKQYSLLLLPGFFLLAMTRSTSRFTDAVPTKEDPPRYPMNMALRDTKIPWWGRILVMSAAIAVPYALFAVLTGQSLPENLVHLASFGGRAFDANAPGDLYLTHGLSGALRALAYGDLEFQIVLPVLAATLLLILLRPTKTSLALAACFIGPLAQLYVRTYPHYLQLSIPWGIAILALLASTIGKVAAHTASDTRLRSAVVMISALPFIGLCMAALYEARVTYLESTLSQQQAFASAVLRVLPQTRDVVILNGPWLHLLADISPPGQDYRFVESPDDELLQQAAYAILFPVWNSSFEEDRQRMEARGFEVMGAIEWKKREAIVYRNRHDNRSGEETARSGCMSRST